MRHSPSGLHRHPPSALGSSPPQPAGDMDTPGSESPMSSDGEGRSETQKSNLRTMYIHSFIHTCIAIASSGSVILALLVLFIPDICTFVAPHYC